MRRAGAGTSAALLVMVAASLLLAAALAGCGRAGFAAGSPPDVPAAVAAAGVQILDQGTATNRHPGGRDATWYAVGSEGSDQASAVVSVLTFDSQHARDAAARDLENSRRAGGKTEGVFTGGDSVVLVKRITDRATAQLLDQALRDAGMK